MSSAAQTYIDAKHIVYTTISLALQSLFYGIYIVIICFSTHILLKRDLKSRANRLLMTVMFFPFIVSSVYWILGMVQQVVRIEATLFHERDSPHILTHYTNLFNALALLNYVFTDGVVAWRAWALCKEDYKKILAIPLVLLALSVISVGTTIVACVITYLTSVGLGADSSHPLIKAIDVLQVSHLSWSLLTNISATSIISHKTWRHRVAVRDDLRNTRNKRTRAERVLAIVVESGILYCVSGATVLFTSMIRLPTISTLGDIYTPINIQIAGIHPTIVIVLVGLQRTLDHTTFWPGSNIVSVDQELRGDAQPAGQIRVDMTQSRVSHIQLAGDLSSPIDRSELTLSKIT